MVVETVIASLQATLFSRGLATANSGNLANVAVNGTVSSPSSSVNFVILAIVPLRHCPGMHVIRVFGKNSFEKDKMDDGPVCFYSSFIHFELYR